MRATITSITDDRPITVNLEALKAKLGCGNKTARDIAERAGAVYKIGKRVLYHVPKIERYIERELYGNQEEE